MAESIECCEDCVTERCWVCLVAACHKVARSSVGCGVDEWQTCCVEYAILVVESMEWYGGLIVVHCHDSIEFAEVTAAEEFVCRVRTKRLDSLVSKVVDSRDDDFAFLFAATLFLIDARIQGEYGDTWVSDEEVTLQCLPEQCCLAHDTFLTDYTSYLSQRSLFCDSCNTEVASDEDAQGTVAVTDACFDVLLVSLEGIAFNFDVLTADWCCNQDIVEIVAIVGHSTVECFDGCSS